MNPDSTVAPAHEPIHQKNPDGPRFASNNIRLSSALCAFGFSLRTDAEPVSVTVDVEAEKPVVTFWHRPEPDPGSPVLVTCPTIKAIDVQAWWLYPGKYSVEGFDDALRAIRRVHETREWLLGILHGHRQIENSRFAKNSVITASLHYASIIKACGFDLIGFERTRPARFVFPGKSKWIIAQLDSAERPNENLSPITRHSSPDRDGDPCVDWMLWALKYRDWLARMVSDPDCIPMMEMRDGERVLRISSKMPDKLKKEWISYL